MQSPRFRHFFPATAYRIHIKQASGGDAELVKTIYIDILFLINFIINYLILFAASRLAVARIRRYRTALGALIGALYGVAVFFKNLSFLNSLIFKIAVSVLMNLCAFGFSDMRKLIKMTLVFFFISFTFGGAVLALYLFGMGGVCEVRNNIYYIHIPLKALLLSAGAAYILLSLVFRRSMGRSRQSFCHVEIEHDGKTAELTALSDTGNTLTDPVTNAPVIISDYSAVRAVLPDSVRTVLDEKNPSDFPISISELPSNFKFRLIPYKTMSSPFSLLLAFRPDKITVDKKNESGAMLAISPQQISDGGAYTAII